MGVYARYVRTRRRFDYILMACLLVLGLMSKPMMVTFPAVLLCLDIWPLERIRLEKWRTLIWEKIPLFLISAAFGLITLIPQKREAMLTLVQCPWTGRIANALLSYVEYIGGSFWPAGLVVIYPYDIVSLLSWKILGAWVVLLGVSAVVLIKARSAPYLLAGWLWYGVTLLPVIGLVQVGWQSMADRYTYVPLIGLFIMGVWMVHALAARWGISKRICGMAAGLVVAGLAAAAWTQTGYWQNSIVLFGRASDVTSKNWVAHYVLGSAYLKEGLLEEAKDHFQRALQIVPDNEFIHNGAGCVSDLQGDSDEAMRCFRTALALDAGCVAARYNLGLALSYRGEEDEALLHLQEVLRLDPTHDRAHYHAGRILLEKGRWKEALNHFQQALQINPDSPGAYVAIAWIEKNHGAIIQPGGKRNE